MNIQETEYQYIFESSDYRGVFQFRIQKDLSQIQLATEVDEWDNEDHANVNLKEVEAIRDMLTRAIEARKEVQDDTK